MANFPSITPSARLYTQGNFPSAIQASSAGVTTGFRRGNRRINQTLQLSFNNLTESQVTQIRNHFDGQNGSFSVFYLSAEVWAGYTTPPVSSSDYKWRYADSFQISISAPSKYATSIELISVPI